MRKVRVLIGLLVVLAVAAALVVTGIQPRVKAREVLRDQANASAVPHLTVLRPTQQAPSEEVILPGNIQAFSDAPIYARTNGYLKRWYFDIGAHVKRGQLLAEIESPEVDEQLKQAETGTTDRGTLQSVTEAGFYRQAGCRYSHSKCRGACNRIAVGSG